MSATSNIIVKQVTLDYTDTTAVSLGYLPPNFYVTGVEVLTNPAFDAGTTNLVDVGVNGTANNLADDVDVSSAGPASVTGTSTWGAIQSTINPTEITAVYVPSGTAATAGSAKVVVTCVEASN